MTNFHEDDDHTSEAQKQRLVKLYADFVNEGVPEQEVCHMLISCGLSLLSSCCCTEHLMEQYRIIDGTFAKAKAVVTPRAN